MINDKDLNRYASLDYRYRNLKFRTIKGLFGISIRQVKDGDSPWINITEQVYNDLNRKKALYSAGQPIGNPVMDVVNQVMNEYKRLEGLALETGNYTSVVNLCWPAHLQAATISADELAIIQEAGNKYLNLMNRVPPSYDDSAIEDWAKAVAYGTAILASLKNQKTLLTIQPKLTRSDVSYVTPFTRSSMVSALLAIKGLRIPPVCYSLAEIYTRILQVGGAERLNSIDSQYFFPFSHGLTQGLFDDQVDALDALSKSGLFANYIGKPLVPISEAWINKIHIVPFYSDWGQAICDLIPIESNSGGVAQFQEDFDDAVDCYYNQTLGMSELYSAAPLFREDTGAATAAVFNTISAPAADKISMTYHSSRSATTGTAVPDNTARFDYIFQVAAARSATQRGIFGHADNFMQYHTLKGDESAWDARLAKFIFTKIAKNKMPVVSLTRLLPSMSPQLKKPNIKISNANQSKYGNG